MLNRWSRGGIRRPRDHGKLVAIDHGHALDIRKAEIGVLEETGDTQKSAARVDAGAERGMKMKTKVRVVMLLRRRN
jgi:hypothetical protein